MNFLKRCWQKRWLRRLTWTAVTLVALCALFCAWVNWSGERQWRATQAMLKTEGETLDFRATMNEPVPESENFCAIPLLKDLALVLGDHPDNGEPGEKRKHLAALKLSPNAKAGARPISPKWKSFARPKLTNAALGKRADLHVWADWLRTEVLLPVPADSGNAARDVLAALAKDDATVLELAAALSRPYAHWTPEWKSRELPPLLANIALPHLTVAQGLNQTLALRAIAAARTGEAAKAHEAVLIIARLNQACLNDPFMISALVSYSGAAMLHGVTWELCTTHTGTAEDFAKLETALAALDFHRAALLSWRSEMAAMVDTIQGMKTRRGETLGLFQMVSGDFMHRGSASDVILRALPAGFCDASSAVLAGLEFRHIIKPLKEPGWQQALASARDLENEMIAMKQNAWMHPSYILPPMIVPASRPFISRCAYSNALVNQAMIACALERHRIASGSYPDWLDAVRLAVGAPLPPDPMDGKPMRYRKTPDGKYALWSIGFDGKDDGGKRTLDEKKPEDTRFQGADYVGDWVWDFPAE